MCQLNVFTSVNWRIFPQKIKCRYYTKLAGNSFLSITNSLANSMMYLTEQYFILFMIPCGYNSTSVIHLILHSKGWIIFIFMLPLCIHIIVWFDYIVANYVTVIPHRAHRWYTWKSGCDRLVSEPTLSELNTILLCLISMTQLHILESRQELRTKLE